MRRSALDDAVAGIEDAAGPRRSKLTYEKLVQQDPKTSERVFSVVGRVGIEPTTKGL